MLFCRFFFLVFLLLTLTIASCSKYKDPKGNYDPRLDSTFYCNDPEAINYNYGFPGTPDNSICFYPTDAYKGNYQFTDSVYNLDNSFDSARSLTTFNLSIFPLSKSRFVMTGYCGGTDSLFFKVERVSLQATLDTVVGMGQFFCRQEDTISGFFSKSRLDSSNKITAMFTVVSDTAINFHRGTLLKQ